MSHRGSSGLRRNGLLQYNKYGLATKIGLRRLSIWYSVAYLVLAEAYRIWPLVVNKSLVHDDIEVDLSRSRRAAAAENFTTRPPPKNACRRAAAADILCGAPPKRCRHLHFSTACFTSTAVLLIYRNKS
jgi:hypothetical protein